MYEAKKQSSAHYTNWGYPTLVIKWFSTSIFVKFIPNLTEYNLCQISHCLQKWFWLYLVDLIITLLTFEKEKKNHQQCIPQFVPKSIHIFSMDRITFSFQKVHLRISSGKCWPFCLGLNMLTHWSRMMHIYISKLTIIGSDNGLAPTRRQAIIWTNVGILLMRTLGTNFSEILGKFTDFHSQKKCICKCLLRNGSNFVLAWMC